VPASGHPQRPHSKGLGAFEFDFDHLTEITGRLADDVVRNHSEERRALG
jgi:hypothetical protein